MLKRCQAWRFHPGTFVCQVYLGPLLSERVFSLGDIRLIERMLSVSACPQGQAIVVMCDPTLDLFLTEEQEDRLRRRCVVLLRGKYRAVIAWDGEQSFGELACMWPQVEEMEILAGTSIARSDIDLESLVAGRADLKSYIVEDAIFLRREDDGRGCTFASRSAAVVNGALRRAFEHLEHGTASLEG